MSTSPELSSALEAFAGLHGRSPEAAIELLLAQVEAMQVELDRLRDLADARRYHAEQMDAEMRLASRMQRDFLPARLPSLGKIRFDVLWRPAGHVGGDLYNVKRLDETHVSLYMADAVGHGMPAALLAMYMMQAVVDKVIDPKAPAGYRLLDPDEALARLNTLLLDQQLNHATFATAVYGLIDVQTARIRFARAGHPLPLVLRKSGELEEVGGEGGLLGILPDEAFEPADVQLEPGDKLVVFSDGVETLFAGPASVADMDAFLDACRTFAPRPASALMECLAARLDAAPSRDDVTVLTVERIDE